MPSRPELDNVRRARRELESARAQLVSAIRAAELAGYTQRDIGAAADLSQGEVWRVLRRGKAPS